MQGHGQCLDPAVVEVTSGVWKYYNTRLAAPNVWEVDVHTSLVEEAASIFTGAKLREAHLGLAGTRGTPVRSFEGGGTRFAVVQPKGWSSDVNWFSVDDTCVCVTTIRLAGYLVY